MAKQFLFAVNQLFEGFYNKCFSAELSAYWSPAVQEIF